MIKSVQAGLKKYKQALREHVAWIRTLENEGRLTGALSDSDHAEAQRRNAALKAMGQVLGLTPEEVRRHEKKAGFDTLSITA